jgi:hypothetical protein
MIYNAGQLATIIKKLGEMDIQDLGNDDATQKSNIYTFMNIAMMKHARLAYLLETSDSLNITIDGYQAFLKNGTSIKNMFEPLYLIDNSGYEVSNRTSYTSPKGWYRESFNKDVHTKGIAGVHNLHYLRYPTLVTTDDSIVDFPPSGYDVLIKEVLAMIKYTRNSYGGAEFLEKNAKEQLNQVAEGSVRAQGTGSTGEPPKEVRS